MPKRGVTRASGSGATPPPKAQRVGSLPSPADALKQSASSHETAQVIVDNTVISEILDLFASEVKSPNLQVHQLLDREYPSIPDKLLFAQWVDKTFPPQTRVKYATDFSVGTKCLRPWMLSWHVNSGNKGMVLHDTMEALIKLICVKSFLSNADVAAGVERLAIQPPNPVLYNGSTEYATCVPGLLLVNQADQQKGWALTYTERKHMTNLQKN